MAQSKIQDFTMELLFHQSHIFFTVKPIPCRILPDWGEINEKYTLDYASYIGIIRHQNVKEKENI